MYIKSGKPFLFFIIVSIFFSCQSETSKIQTPTGEVEISTDELLTIMGETYLYGYPMVLMDITKNVSTNIETPDPIRALAPINQLGHFRRFPDHNMTTIVKPNVDTYYSIAWLDLKDEPQVLSMPATDRYYLMPLYDAYSNVFASPGTRTTGTEAQDFLLVGPSWTGELPDNMTIIKAPTQVVWMLGRIQVNSPEDGATTVRAIQDSMTLVPLSAFGQDNYAAPRGQVQETYKNTVPVKAIQDLDINAYFNKMAQLMVDNPPKAADSIMVKKMAKIGLVPGQPFELSTDNLILKTKLKMLPSFIHKKFEKRRSEPDTTFLKNGWMTVTENIGKYGTDYTRRAYIDFIGLGANLPEDAIYPNCTFDVNGNRLDASQKYQLHFEADELPPVRAFWSLTAYNEDEFLVKNELNRFALGDRDNLKYNEDGSLDLYIQHTKPAEQQLQNWLPIPESGAFFLTMRLYWPKEVVLNNIWKIPALIPVE